MKAILCLSVFFFFLYRHSPSKLDRDGGLCKTPKVGNSSVGLENIGGRGLMRCKLQVRDYRHQRGDYALQMVACQVHV